MYRALVFRRELIAASAEPLILSLLAQGESYGYAIIQEVLTRSKEQMRWTDGMLYPLLHRMERKGFIGSRWAEGETGRKRKYYFLKKKGAQAMNKYHAEWSVVHAVLTGLRRRHV